MLSVNTRSYEETVAWLEDSLNYARSCGRMRTEELLEAVRAEVEFENDFARTSRFARRLLKQHETEDQSMDGESPHVSLMRFQRVIEQFPLAVHVFSPSGKSLLANSAWNELWDLEETSSSHRNIFEDRQVRAAGLITYVEESLTGKAVVTPPLLYNPARIGRMEARRWLRAFTYPSWDKAGKVREVTLIIEDITERKNLEDRFAHRAFHDELTGLPNRALLMDRMGQIIARAEREPGGMVALMFMDLDGFKHVNDSIGHESGDRLLVEAARRLGACTRTGDTVARLGGDAFVILLLRLEKEGEAIEVAERVSKELRKPFRLDGREVFVTASIGVALAEDGDLDPDDLLRSVDIAMYRAKEGGKDRYRLFEPSMDGHSKKRLTLESDLRRALERGEILVFYQPIVELENGKVSGLEALVRWEHPERGLISPAEFIPLAEETGMIIEIGDHVLREACAQACRQLEGARSRGDVEKALTVWVNLSARQLYEPDLPNVVMDVLDETGLDPTCLGLEITESVAMDGLGFGVERTAATLRRLRDIGVEIAIDDFGTGYSSLSYLKRLPVDCLKVDRSFVSGLGEDSGDNAIVSAVISLARTMGIRVTAEGVETREQLDYLEKAGCPEAQGFYFAKPMPEADLNEMISGRPYTISPGGDRS